ncbi:MAG: hypothetical protein DRG39_07255 [Deltaproteobacteria bacterium]|nr:MAG: hypothetical protein DRG39_07255 [Deltaproteobacteria bacterium]
MVKLGSAKLLPQAHPKVVKILEENNVDLKVMGHINDTPVENTNWGLSAARVAAAVRYIIISHSKVIKPTRLQARGLADTRLSSQVTIDTFIFYGLRASEKSLKNFSYQEVGNV